MLSNIVGQMEWPSAAVLIALFIGLGIAFAIYRTTKNYKTTEDIEYDKEKMRLEAARSQYQWETDRIIRTKQLEQNLITSHKEVKNGGDGY